MFRLIHGHHQAVHKAGALVLNLETYRYIVI